MRYTKKEVCDDVLEWVREQLQSKRFGTFGIEITMRQGTPVAIQKTDRLNYMRSEGGIITEMD